MLQNPKPRQPAHSLKACLGDVRVYTGLVSLSTSAVTLPVAFICLLFLASPQYYFFFLAGRCDSCIVTKESYNLLNCVFFFTGFEIFIQKKKNRSEFLVLFLCSTKGKESIAFVSVSAERYLLESRYKFPSSWVSESTVRRGPPPYSLYHLWSWQKAVTALVCTNFICGLHIMYIMHVYTCVPVHVHLCGEQLHTSCSCSALASKICATSIICSAVPGCATDALSEHRHSLSVNQVTLCMKSNLSIQSLIDFLFTQFLPTLSKPQSCKGKNSISAVPIGNCISGRPRALCFKSI